MKFSTTIKFEIYNEVIRILLYFYNQRVFEFIMFFFWILPALISVHARNIRINERNDRPIIGIMTLPSEYVEFPNDTYSYMAASYVKFVESAGARVLPIPYEADPSFLERVFS
jgi:hypothetical protein